MEGRVIRQKYKKVEESIMIFLSAKEKIAKLEFSKQLLRNSVNKRHFQTSKNKVCCQKTLSK